MSIFKERIYSIVHSGYSLLTDSRPNHDGSLIDGDLIRTAPVYENGKLIGHRPTCSSKRVSNPNTFSFNSFLELRLHGAILEAVRITNQKMDPNWVFRGYFPCFDFV